MKFSAAKFASDTGISEKLAKRILALVYEKDLSAEDFNGVLWRLRDWFIKNKLPELIEKLKDEDIEGVIDELIADRARWATAVPYNVACAETPEELAEAFNSIGAPEAVWFFTSLDFSDRKGKKFKAGDTVRIQIMRTGKWNHPMYGEVKVTKKTIRDVVKNFQNRERGVDLAVDENHEPDHKALAWFKDLVTENDDNDLFADVELTKKGADLLNEGAYKYFSPEIVFHKEDEETGKPQRNLLIGGAFTNRPFFKNMKPLMASEDAAAGEQSGSDSAKANQAIFLSKPHAMKKFLEVAARLVEKNKINASEKSELEQAYNELPKEDRSDDINKAFAELLAKFDEEGGTPPAPAAPAPAPEGQKPEEKKEGEEEEGEEDETETEEVQATEGLEGVSMNEDGTYKVVDPVAFSESLKRQQKKFAEMAREAAVAACEKSLAPLVFSEKRPTKVVLPAQKKTIVEFAASLDEAKRSKFFSILKGLRSVPAGELGHSNEKPEPDVTKPETFSEEDDAVKFFMEKFNQDLPTARKSAAAYYAERARR